MNGQIRESAMKLDLSTSKTELGGRAAAAGAELIRRAIAQRGQANIIVATGASQFDMLATLTNEKIDWHHVTGFHLDEYVGLPITHGASFRGYLWQRFVSKLPLPLAAFHYINAEMNPEAECRRLNKIIEKYPIDVAFIGIGENGHIAFNDPPADFVTTKPYIVVELDEACRRQQLGEGWFKTLKEVPKRAISMSVNHITKSQAIICSVPDRRKAEAVRNCLKGPVSPEAPASILQKHKNATIYLDPDSASLL
jgi:glucosamine-6-phosphate deaminase